MPTTRLATTSLKTVNDVGRTSRNNIASSLKSPSTQSWFLVDTPAGEAGRNRVGAGASEAGRHRVASATRRKGAARTAALQARAPPSRAQCVHGHHHPRHGHYHQHRHESRMAIIILIMGTIINIAMIITSS